MVPGVDCLQASQHRAAEAHRGPAHADRAESGNRTKLCGWLKHVSVSLSAVADGVDMPAPCVTLAPTAWRILAILSLAGMALLISYARY